MYGPDAGRVPTTPDQARIRAAFEGALLPAARPSLHHEPALDLVARVVADMAGEGQPPSQALIQWLFWRAGATSRYARVELMIAQGVDDLDLQTVELEFTLVGVNPALDEFKDMAEEHMTFVLRDPSNNLIEFKHYVDPRLLY